MGFFFNELKKLVPPEDCVKECQDNGFYEKRHKVQVTGNHNELVWWQQILHLFLCSILKGKCDGSGKAAE